MNKHRKRNTMDWDLCLIFVTIGIGILIPVQCKMDEEAIMNMNKNEDLLNSEAQSFRRIIRDVDNGSGTDSEPNALKQHTDIHVFTNDSNPSISLIWSGKDGVLLALTTMGFGVSLGQSRLYRSDNFGRSFKDISAEIHNDRILNNHGLQVNPVDSNNVILVTDKSFSLYSQGKNYLSVIHVTSDNGQSFDRKELKFILDPSTIQYNKHNALQLLTIATNNHGLWISKDYGLVWRLISYNVLQVRWDPNDANAFYYTKDPTGRMLSGQFTNELYRARTSTIQSTKIAEHVYSFGIQGGFLFISVEYLNKNGSRMMHVSKDKGVSWDAAQIPLINKKQFYSLLDMSEDMVFVHVDSAGGTGDGSIYTSDERGIIYSKSLEHHLYPSVGSMTDFYKVSSLQGVYITSQLDHKETTIHSMITFNKGGTWQTIDPPKGTSCPKTEKECRLQIHSLFSKSKGVQFSEFPKSSPSATGIIIVHANTGDALNFNPPSVFISNDGGYTWITTDDLKGPHFYAIGDSGGLLYAVRSSELTNIINYSADEGQTWEEHVFSDSKIIVTGLSVEPGSRTTLLGLWGWDKAGDGAWRAVTVDFSSILKKSCGKGDYEEWKAHESNTMYGDDGCLLGADVIFNRRKKGSLCINGKDYLNPITVKPCQCQKTDYLCDYGYVRKNVVDCVLDDNFDNHIDICMSHEEETIETKGYRKIPGDKCTAGFSPDYDVISLHKTCSKKEIEEEDFGVDTEDFSEYHPPVEIKHSSPGLIVFLVFVVIALIVAVVFLVRKRHLSGKRVKYVPLPTDEGQTTDYGTDSASLVDVTTHSTTPPPRQNGYNNKSSLSYHDDSDEDLLVS